MQDNCSSPDEYEGNEPEGTSALSELECLEFGVILGVWRLKISQLMLPHLERSLFSVHVSLTC